MLVIRLLDNNSVQIAVYCVIGICLTTSKGAEPTKQAKSVETVTMIEIKGEFTVKLTPVDIGDAKMGMMTLDKQYLGDLAATGKGRMLTGMTDVKASAGYVAIERIEGTLNGAKGSFLIQHNGIMNKGKPTLEIKVIPDSGTDELTGIEGTMEIEIVEKKHYYRLKYLLKK